MKTIMLIAAAALLLASPAAHAGQETHHADQDMHHADQDMHHADQDMHHADQDMHHADQERHHGKHQADPQMAKLHKMMPRYAKAQASIGKSLEKGDLKAVIKQTDYLLASTADLKKSKPHKNIAQLPEFQTIAGNFERDVSTLAESAKKGDLDGARAAFASASQKCASCHAKFRAH